MGCVSSDAFVFAFSKRELFNMYFSLLLIASFLSALAAATLQIVPGATWTAKGTNQHVQAHGGGIVEVNGVFYWIGENKLDGSAFQSINCYSSTVGLSFLMHEEETEVEC